VSQERPYKDGFGDWQVMISHDVPEAERAGQAAVQIAEAMRADGQTPPEGGVQVESRGTWTTFEHFEAPVSGRGVPKNTKIRR
jgi:hypothetical protein